ncbi:histone-lysine N-methyltransferase PRDM7-like [Mustelus asterias]
MGKSKSDRADSGEGKTLSEQRKSEITDQFKDISAHFSKDEWAELSEWEKVRYKNVKRNYEAMLAIGLNAPKPAFMSRHGRGRQPPVYESSNSDEDWTPKRLVKNPPQVRSLKLPFKNEDSKKTENVSIRKNQKDPSSIASPSEEDKNDGFGGFPNDTVSAMEETVSVKNINKETVACAGNSVGSSNQQTTKEIESRRYNLRNREGKVYTEERELCDDDYLFCEDCETFFIEECPVHGPPIFIKDMVVEFSQPDRARLTLPEGLSIATSKIRKAGLGVWNEGKIIPKGVHFGPYEGVISNEESAAVSGYSWMISKGKQDFEYIDAKDESNSNWMRFVNCARKEEEQNLVAFQHQGKIYYRTCKPVPPRCELLVWYGDEYAKELGIKWMTMWNSKQQSKSAPTATGEGLPNTIRVKTSGGGSPVDRDNLMKKVLFECCGFQAADFYGVAQYNKQPFVDVSFKSLTALKEKGKEGPLPILTAEPLFTIMLQRNRVITFQMYNPFVPAADMLTFLSRYVEVKGESVDVMDKYGSGHVKDR